MRQNTEQQLTMDGIHKDLPVALPLGFILASVFDTLFLIHHCLDDHLVRLVDRSYGYVSNSAKLT